MSLTLLINGQAADYFDREDFPLVLRRQSVDYKDPAARRGETSFTVRLPNTANNQRILGPLYTLAQEGKFRTGNAPRCVVEVGGAGLISGRFTVTAVRADEIEGFISASIGDFAQDMRGKTLRGLDMGEQPFEGWKTMLENIGRQVQNLGDEVPYGLPYTHTEDVIAFPLVSYGNPFLPNKWTTGTMVDVTDWSALYGVTINLPSPKEIFGRDTYYFDKGSAFHLGFQDVPPVVYVVKVLEAMFTAAGWTLRGAWLNSDAARRLVMPYVGERPYIYNWELLGTGEYEYEAGMTSENAIIIQASQDQDASLVPVPIYKVKVWSFEIVQSGPHPKSIAQLYYKTTVPLGGTVNLPTAAGQLLDNWRVYLRLLYLPIQIRDYAFTRLLRRFATWGTDDINDTNYHSHLYFAPVDGIYTVSLEITVSALLGPTLLDSDDNNVPITQWNTDINGLRYAFGISVIPGGGDAGAFLDGEFTIRQDLTGQGAANVVAASVIPGAGTYTVEGSVRLEKGDALAFWLGMTSPYAPDVYTGDDQPAETLADNAVKVGPYSPFSGGFLEATDPFKFTAGVTVSDAAATVFPANLPETPEEDRWGVLLKPGQNLPEIQQLDFLKSLVGLFNLWLNVDPEARTVTIQGPDDFFLPPASAHDLTEKGGPDTFEIRPPDLTGSVRFTWVKDGSDFLTAERGADYDVLFETELSGARDETQITSGVFASTEFADYKVVEHAIEPIVAMSTQWAAPVFQVRNALRVPSLADKDSVLRIQNESAAPQYGYEPRLLQVWQSVLVNPADFTKGLPVRVFDDDLPVGDRDYYDRLTHHIELSFDGRGDGAGEPYPTLAWRGDGGLFAAFYQDLYRAIARGYEAEAAFHLTAVDWLKMTVSRPLRYNGVLYYLKEIKAYNPVSDKLTRVVLVKR